MIAEVVQEAIRQGHSRFSLSAGKEVMCCGTSRPKGRV